MDWQALGVGVAAVVTAGGGVILGVYTGRNKAKVDQETATQLREQAEEVASRARVEGMAADNAEMRRRIREMDDLYEDRTRDLRRESQRNWDLANFHYGSLTVIAHLLNNLFMFITLNDDKPVNTDGLVASLRNAKVRVYSMHLPRSLEEPLNPKPQDAPP